MTDSYSDVPDAAEQLDQLDSEDTLVTRDVVDPLDEGYIPPDGWSVAQEFGNTAAEMRAGESLEQRVRQEEPEHRLQVPGDEDSEGIALGAVGDKRAGRLVDANQGYPGRDNESELIGSDVGISGAAATAEEAAMHVVDDYRYDDDGNRLN